MIDVSDVDPLELGQGLVFVYVRTGIVSIDTSIWMSISGMASLMNFLNYTRIYTAYVKLRVIIITIITNPTKTENDR
jgi:hypothetical protein